MAAGVIIDGTIIKIFVGGTAVAHSTSGRLEFEKDTRKITTKDSGSWEEVEGTRKRATFSGDFLHAENPAYGFEDLFAVLDGTASVTVMMSSEVSGHKTYSAPCELVTLNRDTPLDDNTAGSYSFKTCGAVTEATVA